MKSKGKEGKGNAKFDDEKGKEGAKFGEEKELSR